MRSMCAFLVADRVRAARRLFRTRSICHTLIAFRCALAAQWKVLGAGKLKDPSAVPIPSATTIKRNQHDRDARQRTFTLTSTTKLIRKCWRWFRVRLFYLPRIMATLHYSESMPRCKSAGKWKPLSVMFQ
ncbi:unnamed protein product, partial [Ixodes persulcatus]